MAEKIPGPPNKGPQIKSTSTLAKDSAAGANLMKPGSKAPTKPSTTGGQKK